MDRFSSCHYCHGLVAVIGRLQNNHLDQHNMQGKMIKEENKIMNVSLLGEHGDVCYMAKSM